MVVVAVAGGWRCYQSRRCGRETSILGCFSLKAMCQRARDKYQRECSLQRMTMCM